MKKHLSSTKRKMVKAETGIRATYPVIISHITPCLITNDHLTNLPGTIITGGQIFLLVLYMYITINLHKHNTYDMVQENIRVTKQNVTHPGKKGMMLIIYSKPIHSRVNLGRCEGVVD